MKFFSGKVVFAIIALLACARSTPAAPESKPEMVLQVGHDAQVNAVAFSGDGKILASADESGNVQIREVADGAVWRSLRGPRGAAGAIAFSRDGKNVAAAFSDGGLALWDVATGALRWQKSEAIHENLTLAFAPDGQSLAVGGRERKNFSGEIRFFDITNGKPLVVWKTANYEEAYCMAFSLDGSTLAVGDSSATIMLLDTLSGKNLKRLKGHFGRIESLAFSPDGSTLLSGSGDATARLWSAKSGRLLRTWTAHLGEVNSVAFSPAGDEAYTLSAYGVRVWSIVDGRALRSFRELDGLSMALAPNGKTFALALTSADEDAPSRIGIFNSSDGKASSLWNGYRDEINSVSFQNTVTGMRLLTGHGVVTGDDEAGANQYLVDKKGRPWQAQAFGVARVWDFQKGNLQNALRDDDGKIGDVHLARDGKRVLTFRYDAPVWWDAPSGKLLKILEGHTHAIFAVAVSPDGNHLATGGFDEKARIWNLKTNRAKRAFPAQGKTLGMPTALAWARDGRVLFAGYSEGNDGGESGTLCAWDVQSGKILWRIKAHDDEIWQLAVSPDGKFLACADNSGELQKRDAQSGKLIWRVRAHQLEDATKIAALDWSPDGSTLATGSQDALVKTWDARNGRLLRAFAGHGALVNSVTFSPQGKTLLSASDDGTIRFWNAHSGAWRGALRTLPRANSASWIAWNSDGFYDGSPDVEKFVRWNDGENLLPADAFDKRRAGLLAELISAD